MDGITPGGPKRPNPLQQDVQKPTEALIKSNPQSHKFTLKFKLPSIPKLSLNKIKNFKYIDKSGQLSLRLTAGVMAFLIIFSFGYDMYTLRFNTTRYELSAQAELLLGKTNKLYAQKLVFNSSTQQYGYNEGYAATPGEVAGTVAGPKFTATVSADPAKGITINDSVNSTGVTLIPKFGLESPTKKENRLIYPIKGMAAAKVDTLRAGSVKEDIILEKYQRDEVSFKYEIKTADGTAARMESNGSIGIYGADSTLLGNVTASSDKDQELLKKARENAKKTKLLFTIPAPYIMDVTKKVSTTAKSWYTLENNILTLHASKLNEQRFPLTIDPTVYIETAAKLMKGNNETNIDFDVNNELIQKSQTTGARIDSWTAASDLNTGTWAQGTAVAGGYIYSAGGITATQSVKVATYYTAGTSTFTVPTGVTSLTAKVWGAGGGGGSGTNGTTNAPGGNGGGGGYANATFTVTPGEGLNIMVGTGGAGGANNSNDGGNGGGFSAVRRGAGTYLVQAGGGGGGGGTRTTAGGGDGGAGGGATALPGIIGTGTTGGGPGGAGAAAGGAAGTAGTSGAAGSAGAANAGGNSGGSVTNCATAGAGSGGAGGTGGGGDGGAVNTCQPGGGGGGGRFGGGGGGSTSSAAVRAGGGGGGGSSLVTGTFTIEKAGLGKVPGNSGDPDRTTAGNGGVGAVATAGTTGSDGGVVLTYTVPSSIADSNTVSWAKFNTSTNAIESPNPGAGACSGWCTNSAYNLPTTLKGLSLVAYNGYLYALGGQDSSCTAGNSTGATGTCYTVYIAKIGANGEPQLWHPTGGTPTYWYRDTNLSSERAFFGAVVYNNRMYLLGGLNGSNTTISTVQYAPLNPIGTIGSWSSGTALSAARYGLTAQIYNDTIYVIGGNATFTGTPISTVQYAKVDISTGAMTSWQTASSLLTSGRQTMGGSFSTIWAGYIYVGGGCTAVNGSGYCTALASDVQIASINADGSLGPWNTIIGLENARMGYTLIAWQNGLYRLGGCEAQDASTGVCQFIDYNVEYGVINPEGEASTVATSSASGTSPCSGGSPTGCNLPGSSIVGNVLNSALVLNGYLYVMGGCTDDACTTVSRGVTYQSISNDGSLTKPASCGSWSTVDSYCYNTTSLTTGIGAAGTAAFGGRLYVVGGFPNIANIYYATPAPDGSIPSWTAADLTTIGAEDVSYTFAYARANPASAGSTPGNLYLFGGCTSDGNVSCTTMTQNVYKCTISTTGAPAACSTNPGGTNPQLAIGTATDGAGGSASGVGLGAHAGTVYANYIYLLGGLSPGLSDLKTSRYAKFDDNNNVVAVSGGAWIETSAANGNLTFFGRRRGTAFGFNGYIYVVGGYDGTSGGGVLADIEFAQVDVSDGSIGTFRVSSVNINQRWGLGMAVSNSYAYVIGGCISGQAPSNCNRRTDTIQTFQIYNNDSGAIQAFTNSAGDFATDAGRWGASSTVLNGYLYVAGGCTSATDCTTTTNSVQYAQIDANNGSIGTWNNGGNLPAVTAWGQLVSAGGNTLYYVGGQNNAGTAQTAVYYTTGISSGNPTWGTAANGLPAAKKKLAAVSWNNRIYTMGGTDTTPATSTAVYVSPLLSSGGNINSAWTTSTSFDVARYGTAAVAYANNLYIFGGNDGTNYLNDAQFASIGYKTGTISQSSTTLTGSGTTWTAAMVGSVVQYPDGSTATITAFGSATSLTVSASKTVTAGTTYVIMDGSVGAWTNTTSLPGPISEGTAVAANGYIYVIGGRSTATACSPSTLLAPISANTTITTGNNPTGVGEWFETNVKFPGGRYGVALAYNSGKFYMMGGGCTSPQTATYVTGTIQQTTSTITGTGTTWSDNYVGGTITYQDASTATIISVTDATHMVVNVSKTVGAGQTYSIATGRHFYATVKSQPQVAKYSRMIDTDTDVFPTKWLMNGLDNSVGARWQVKYRSSTAATASWGQETNFGDVTLGNTATYTPKDSGGTNTNFARYYYFSVNIDSSQTFGYPEDVARGPTIYDLSLFFTADPSKRLIHGKTFVGGQQQPLDTPCGATNPNCL